MSFERLKFKFKMLVFFMLLQTVLNIGLAGGLYYTLVQKWKIEYAAVTTSKSLAVSIREIQQLTEELDILFERLNKRGFDKKTCAPVRPQNEALTLEQKMISKIAEALDAPDVKKLEQKAAAPL